MIKIRIYIWMRGQNKSNIKVWIIRGVEKVLFVSNVETNTDKVRIKNENEWEK